MLSGVLNFLVLLIYAQYKYIVCRVNNTGSSVCISDHDKDSITTNTLVYLILPNKEHDTRAHLSERMRGVVHSHE